MNEMMDDGAKPKVVRKLEIRIEQIHFENGQQTTLIHGTQDLVLALSLLNDAQNVVVDALVKREMTDKGEGKKEPRIIVPNMRISPN